MAHAPTAADEFNKEHNLKPVVSFDQDHPTLSLVYRF
jgi:hypothetical protein